MYCVKCGVKLNDDANFCHGCGEKIGGKSVYNINKEDLIEKSGFIKEVNLKQALEKKKIIGTSMLCMVVAIICCLMPWFNIPGMGTYAALEWEYFVDNVGYYYSYKIAEQANSMLGASMWMNAPLILYVLNVIMIWKNGKSSKTLNIVGLFCSLVTFAYAQDFFTYYNNYVLGNRNSCSMQSAFYIMIIVVAIDLFKDFVHKEKVTME